MRNFVFALGCTLALALLLTPSAFADATTLTLTNNCGAGCNPPVPQGTTIGTVDVEQGGNANTLTVTLTMAPGFSLKTQGGPDFSFNAPAGTTVSNVGVSWGGGSNSNVNFGIRDGRNVSSFGTFAYSITGIGSGFGPGSLHGVTSVTTLTFTITATGAIPPAQLLAAFNGKGSDFAIHFCDAGGSNCALYTGFAGNGGATVPEPPVTALLACSTLVFGGFLRRFL